jgi:hypothetical protein
MDFRTMSIVYSFLHSLNPMMNLDSHKDVKSPTSMRNPLLIFISFMSSVSRMELHVDKSPIMCFPLI